MIKSMFRPFPADLSIYGLKSIKEVYECNFIEGIKNRWGKASDKPDYDLLYEKIREDNRILKTIRLLHWPYDFQKKIVELNEKNIFQIPEDKLSPELSFTLRLMRAENS